MPPSASPRASSLVILTAAFAGSLLAPSGALGQQPKQPSPKPAAPAPATPGNEPGGLPSERVEPKTVWPAGLERLAGRYVFVQVGSPGGLWMKGNGEPRQIAIDDLPAAIRTKLKAAEIVISDLKLPSMAEASQRESPSKRGMLRFFSESCRGQLVVRNLPGVSASDDARDYRGPVIFRIEHAQHSNPSITGVLDQRLKQESTWGAATLDYADLAAEAVPPDADAKPPKNGNKPGEEEHLEADTPLSNVRVMRNGVELFAYVSVTEMVGGRERTYYGSLRMMRAGANQAPRPDPTTTTTRRVL